MHRKFVLPIALALAALASWPGSAPAGQSAAGWQWRQNGYGGGGRFTAVAFDVLDPATVYVGSDVAGFFRSRDAARSFTPLGRDLTGLAVADILSTPDAGLLILTDNGLFVSDDQGETQRSVSAAIRYADRQPGSRLILPAPDGGYFVATDDNGVYRAAPDATEWRLEPLGLAGVKVNGLALWQGLLYVATDQGVRRLDQGVFVRVNQGLPGSSPRITDIAADARGLYCLEYHCGLYALSGDVWTAKGPSPAQLPGTGRPTFKNLAANPARPGDLLAASHPDHWPHLLLKTPDAGASWRQSTQFILDDEPPNWATGLQAVERIAFSPDGALGVLADWWNVWRTVDGGASWRQCRKGLQNTVVNAIAVHPDNAERLYLATSDNGLMRSDDGGAHWRRSMAGVVDGDAKAVVLAPGRPDTVYLLMTPWESQDTADAVYFHVYRSDDAGETWRLYRLSDRRKSLAVDYADGKATALAVAPDAPDLVYAAVNGYGIYALDAGARPTGGDLPGRNIAATIPTPYFHGAQALLIPPGDPKTLYAATLEGGLYRTSDGGVSWRQLPGTAGFVFAVAADPGAPTHLLAAAAQKTLLESRDGGASWQSRPLPGERPDEQPASAVAFGPPGSGLVFVGTAAYDNKIADGLFVSTDGGAAYARADNALPRVGVNALAVRRQQPQEALVGFNGLGLYSVGRPH